MQSSLIENHHYHYRAFGLGIGSNCLLPGVPQVQNQKVDVWIEVRSGEKEECPASEKGTFGSTIQTLPKTDGDYTHIQFHGNGQLLNFEITPSGNHVWVWGCYVIEELVTLIMSQVIGCVLRLKGYLTLHACVVNIGGNALLVVGHSGAGKSTLTAALAKRGYAVLADDIAVLTSDGQSWIAQPGIPRLRLWPESAEVLGQETHHLKRVYQFLEKRQVELCENNTAFPFTKVPAPLKSIYVLGKRKEDLDVPYIEPVAPLNALGTLMANRSVSQLNLTPQHQTQEFQKINQAVQQVPVRLIERPDHLGTLPQVCDRILADFRYISGGSS